MVEEAFTFDDVLVEPAYSDIDSRTEINTSVEFLGNSLSVPIIPANMDYISGVTMLKATNDFGSVGILHRFWESVLLWSEAVDDLDKKNIPFYISVGVRNLEETIDEYISGVSDIPNCLGVCIDVAHGHHKKVEILIKETKKAVPRLNIIAGNVATAEGAKFLQDAGADAIKVGIGAGSACTTRTVSGVGVPQLQAIAEAASAVTVPIIADGGIRGPADVFKALIAGARVVMAGYVFAGTDECPVHTVIGEDGKLYKAFRGQSSFGVNGDRYVKEGVEGYVPYRGPVVKVFEELQAGLRSGMSYIGARNISEITDKGRFVLVSPSVKYENLTRIRETI